MKAFSFLILATGIAGVASSEVLTIDPIAPWPVIHQNLGMTKDAPFCGPETNQVSVNVLAAGNTIVNLHGVNYLYAQTTGAGKTPILAFDPADLTQYKFRYDLPGVYTDVGGGVIDSKNYQWWTSKSQLVRLNEDLTEAIFSSKLPGQAYNGTTLLPDGNMLVTSMPLYSVVGTTPVIQKRKKVLPILMVDGTLASLDFGSERPNPVAEAGFGPRPATDGVGGFYFVLPKAIFRVSYDPLTQKLGLNNGTQVDWVYWAPADEEYGVSDVVIVDNNVCFNSVPEVGKAGLKVTCVDKFSGRELAKISAFAESSDLTPTWHTLGGSAGNDLLLVISNSTNGSGGIQAFDLRSIASGAAPEVWTKNLPNISEAFTVAGKSNRTYIASREKSWSALSGVRHRSLVGGLSGHPEQ